jgi:hypothetical protein
MSQAYSDPKWPQHKPTVDLSAHDAKALTGDLGPLARRAAQDRAAQKALDAQGVGRGEDTSSKGRV